MRTPSPFEAYAYVKPSVHDEPADTMHLSEADSPVLRDIGSDLLVAYLVDSGEHYSYIQQRDLTEHGLTADELHDTAVRNLATFAAERLEVHEYGSIYAVLAGGTFEASFILVDELWNQKFRSLVDDQYLAVLPSRDVLAFSSRSRTEAVPELLAVVDRAWASGDHLISQSVFCRVGDKWVTYERSTVPA